MKKLFAVLVLTSALAHTAWADKTWNANPNAALDNRISGMYAQIGGPLGSSLRTCQLDAVGDCNVIVMANGGIHASATDDRQHFTVRFAGANAPYGACHIYPQDPANPNSKALSGATCYDANHVGAYIKLN